MRTFREDERINLLLLAALVMVIRSTAAARARPAGTWAPVVMVPAGVVVGLLYENSIAAELNTEVRQAVEIILAVLLFVDAAEVQVLDGQPAEVDAVESDTRLVADGAACALASGRGGRHGRRGSRRSRYSG
ncbi:hypothetical protein ABJI51_04370 [Amycolatopsis sp. NEAU-NG30]|uniref:Uncharacterized protein n=1 Tax=Amycolatopsis melonis TaxID=3156488 RepID=A0ABV0L7L4_9PSEU